MTKHRDVNKCRRKDKCKMAALIGQANKRVRNGDKKARTHGGKEEKKEEQQTNKTLSEKKEEARNASDQRDKGWIHLIRVHDTTH